MNGQHFTTQIKFSSVLSGLAAKYFIPGKNPLTDQYAISADAQKFSPKNGQSFSEKFSGSYLKTIHEWQHAMSLNYLIERFQVESNPSEVSRILYPSYSLSRIKVDNLINPKNGTLFNFTLQGSNEHIVSSTSFVQSEIKGKYIFSPTDLSRVIIRGDLGYTVVKHLSRLPLTLNFFAGGFGSVRGYEYSSIGPGRYLETASAEFQHRIYGDFSGAVFYDAGTATNHFNDPLFRGEGVGVVYNSVIGPIQVYVGRAMSKPGKPLSVQLSIGPDF
jgi:translocation and assembly module TamA